MQHERRRHGFSLLELMVATVIVVTGAAMMIGHLTISYRSARDQKGRVFAFMAAKSLLSEIQAYTLKGDQVRLQDVDQLDDIGADVPTLSIQTDANGDLIAPDEPVSGNVRRGTSWLWARSIRVRPLPGLNNRSLRYVTVDIRRWSNGNYRTVASLSTVVNTLAVGYPTTQVFDVYLLAVENIPGWWVFMDSIRPFVEAVLTDLEKANPGLELRAHWITKSSYGRNPAYRPYINEDVDSLQPIPWVYHYPGRMPAGNASTYYYVPSLIRGRLLTENGERNGYDVDRNPYPYALADHFNHAMRLPVERAFHDERVAAIRARADEIRKAEILGTTVPEPYVDMSEEPTLRLLLEDMASDPVRYRHALVVNLHGELMPMPPIRNYSDAASDPVNMPGVRVVTHPERIRTPRPDGVTAGESLDLRVYAYTEDPTRYSGPDRMPRTRPIAIQVYDLDLTDGSTGLHPGVEILDLAGGVPVGPTLDRRYRPFAAAKNGDVDAVLSGEMHYTVRFVDPGPARRKFTLIRLYHTPVVAPPVRDDGLLGILGIGLPGNTFGLFDNTRSRLYGLEYVPSAPGSTVGFGRDLATAGDGPKNTARWVIRIGPNVFADRRFVGTSSPPVYFDPRATSTPDVEVEVATRIWNPTLTNPLETGKWSKGDDIRIVQPENLSQTFSWWADAPGDVPATETFQFQGDPRHMPYLDLMHGALGGLADGYNWYWDSLANVEDARADHPSLDPNRLFNGFNGRVAEDVPRMFGLYRDALVRTRSVFSSINGWSFYYAGIGGEIGYDAANGYPNSIPVDMTPYGQPGVQDFAHTIARGRPWVRSAETAGWWMGMPWLGELFPDSVYATQWASQVQTKSLTGNLVAGTGGATEFFQQERNANFIGSRFDAWGTALVTAEQRTLSRGAPTFFNNGTNTTAMNHSGAGGNGTLQGPGLEIGDNYGLTLPTLTPASRPWRLDAPLPTSGMEHWTLAPYAARRTVASLSDVYYAYDATRETSAVIQLTDPVLGESGFAVINGFDTTAQVGVNVIARYAVTSLVHTYFELSDPSLVQPKPLLPRVEIQHPTEITELASPTSVDVRYEVSWTRWDGQDYTQTIGAVSDSELALEYQIMWSRDFGQTWQFVQDNSPAVAGERSRDTSYQIPDFGAGPEVFAWPLPSADFPGGAYLVRVEAYRLGENLHYAFHNRLFFVER